MPRATLGRYVPGSVFKIVTAIAGLGSGAITPDTTYAEQPRAEEGGLRVEGFRIRDGHHPRAGGDKRLDLIEATEVSCNIYYALTGLATGSEQLVDYARRLGFGSPIHSTCRRPHRRSRMHRSFGARWSSSTASGSPARPMGRVRPS